MLTLRPQQTLAAPAVVRGHGYWSGQDVHVEFRPARVDTGIVFVRRDLGTGARIPAAVPQRVETPRRTTLRRHGAGVEMVEHMLAALAGLCIDNCEIWVDAPEMPGCDGSSLAFVEALDAAGTVPQESPRAQLWVREVLRLGDEESWIEARPSAKPGLWLNYRLDYGRNSPIGRQSLSLRVTPESFRRELAPARTFLLESEAQWLRRQGLGTRATAADLLVFGATGPIDNTLRFPDECVRHKALDVVGDLALSGCDIQGHVTAHRSGHRLNAELVQALLMTGEWVGSRRRTA